MVCSMHLVKQLHLSFIRDKSRKEIRTRCSELKTEYNNLHVLLNTFFKKENYFGNFFGIDYAKMSALKTNSNNLYL